MNTLEVVLIAASLSISITLISVYRTLSNDIVNLKLDIIKLYEHNTKASNNILVIAKKSYINNKNEVELSNRILAIKEDIAKYKEDACTK